MMHNFGRFMGPCSRIQFLFLPVSDNLMGVRNEDRQAPAVSLV